MSEVSNKVKYSSYLLIIVASASMLFGTLYVLIPQPMFYHLHFLGMSFDEVKTFSPKLAIFVMVLIHWAGACLIGLGIFGLGIAVKPFRRTEPWAWTTTFSAVTVVLVALTIITFYCGEVIKWLILLMLIVFLIAMFLPFRDFFGREKK